MSHSYQVYGVGIESTTRIAGLEPCPLDPRFISLRFETGPETEWVKREIGLNGRIVVHRSTEEATADPAFILREHGNGKFYELSYSEGARFVVNDSTDRLWGTVQPPLTDEDLASFFLGPVMGFVLRKRHVTCLHASGVELQGRAVIFSGNAGYGKSTTAGALALRGVPILSDDIVPLELTETGVRATPGYPRVCLWPESVEKLVGEPEALPRLTPVWEKRFLPLDGVRARFSAEKKPLGLIYVLGERSSEESAPRVEEITSREALLHLVQNTYMNWLLDRAQRAEEFDQLWKVVKRIPVRRIVPHRDPARIGALCELIQADAERTLARVE